MPDWYFACLLSRARCDDPSQNNANDLRPDRKQTSPLVQSYTRDWAAYELKHGQMMERVVDNLFGREGALLQPCLHVHHLWVNRAQVGDVGLVSIRCEPTDHVAKLSNHVSED